MGFSCATAVAQNGLPPAYQIKTDTAIKLDEVYWQMLEDKGGKLTIDEVSESPLAEKFHYSTSKTRELYYSIGAYWLRFRLQNDMTHEEKIAIYTDAAYADYYILSLNGNPDHQLTGFGVPWSKRDGLKRVIAVTYTIPPGQELVVYERYNFHLPVLDPETLQIYCTFGDKVIQENYDRSDSHILYSFLLGVLVLAALFNFYFYLITRERIYLLFSLTLLFRSIITPLLGNSTVFFPEHPIINTYLLWPAALVLHFFFMIHFVRYFLETFKYVPRWDKFLVALSIWAILYFSLIPMEIIPGIPKRFIFVGVGVANFFIFVTFILSLWSGSKLKKWTIVATLPGLLILVTPLFYFLFSELGKYSAIPVPHLVNWLTNRLNELSQVGLIWLLIFFSWSLFQRFQQLQNQINEEKFAKERLASEKEMERRQLIAQRTELEMQSLRAQMNPHFIFNSLNSINRFILQNNRAQASEYLTKFSRLVRLILQNSQSKLIPLQSELESLELYIEMEVLRFDHHFDYEITVAEGLDIETTKVPPLIIQPYVENAIWHGLMHKEEKGQLEIEASHESNYLLFKIRDDGIGRNQAAAFASKSATRHKSMGLKITAERIAMLHQSDSVTPVIINDLVTPDGNPAGTEIIIKIPVIND